MVLVAGAGAVGTILAAYLSAAKQPVRLLIRERDTARFAAVPQVQVDPSSGAPPFVAPGPEIVATLDLTGIRYLLICVKFPALEAFLDQLPQPLPPDLTLVSTLNGIRAIRRIRERFPRQKAVSMSVMFNGQLLGPLHAQITTRAQVILGTDDARLLGLFAGSGMSVLRAEGDRAVWGKLLINLANAVCALTHTTFKDLLTQPDLRAIYVAVLDEAIGLMEHAGIPYQLPMPIPYRTYRRILLYGGPIPWWVAKAKNGLREGAYPSMVADIEGGRKTEVEQLNGEIVGLGREQGRPTPVNGTIVELLQRIEGRLPPTYLTPAELRERLRI